jgi:ABC-type Mn2+/Zn2+ transport system permease subunit
VAGYALGLALSTALDLPSGPVIVWMLAALAVATGLWRKRARAPAATGSA